MTSVKATRIYRDTAVEKVTITVETTSDSVFIHIQAPKSSKTYDLTREDWDKLKENT